MEADDSTRWLKPQQYNFFMFTAAIQSFHLIITFLSPSSPSSLTFYIYHQGEMEQVDDKCLKTWQFFVVFFKGTGKQYVETYCGGIILKDN